MPISCFCSHCGARISAPERAAGRKARCPNCRAEIVVPKFQAKDATWDAGSALEVLPVEHDAPQAHHWSAPPPVRLRKVSEDKAPPKRVETNPEVLQCQEDNLEARTPKDEPSTVRLAEDSEDKPPQSSRSRLVTANIAVWGGVSLVVVFICILFIAVAASRSNSARQPDIGTAAEAIDEARSYVDYYAYGKGSRLWGESDPIWRAGDNCRAVLNGETWTVYVPVHVVDRRRFEGDANAFFTILARKVRPGHGHDVWEFPGGLKYHGKR